MEFKVKSAYCLPQASSASAQRGFTLLELIVVVAIIAGALALVGPALFGEIARAEERAARDNVISQLTNLSFRSFREGRALRFEPQARLAPGNPHIDLPEGWAIEFRSTFGINVMGVCSGGRLAVIGPDGQRREYALDKPFCDQPRALDDA
jgi:prepilin-type N-terminal cleavage/methylation domain-containing protein